MIILSFFVFLLVIRIVVGREDFKQKTMTILSLSFFIVGMGMLFGKYGPQNGIEMVDILPGSHVGKCIIASNYLEFEFEKNVTLFIPKFSFGTCDTCIFLFFSWLV
jgi:hypothetical protein